jgi:hypothetical protein
MVGVIGVPFPPISCPQCAAPPFILAAAIHHSHASVA